MKYESFLITDDYISDFNGLESYVSGEQGSFMNGFHGFAGLYKLPLPVQRLWKGKGDINGKDNR